MLTGLSILVVEDEPIIAMLIAADVEALGGIVLGPFDSVAGALETLADNKISGAIMDANAGSRYYPDRAAIARSGRAVRDLQRDWSATRACGARS